MADDDVAQIPGDDVGVERLDRDAELGRRFGLGEQSTGRAHASGLRLARGLPRSTAAILAAVCVRPAPAGTETTMLPSGSNGRAGSSEIVLGDARVTCALRWRVI